MTDKRYAVVRFDHEMSNSEYEEKLWTFIDEYSFGTFLVDDGKTLVIEAEGDYAETDLKEALGRFPVPMTVVDMPMDQIQAIVTP